MGRPIAQEYVERNEKLVARYRDDVTVTLADLSMDTGLTKLRLRFILEEFGVTVRPEPKPSRLRNKFRDNHLVFMGARLQAERVKRGWSPTQMAIELGISEPNLGAAFQGLYNWRFQEMVKVCTAFDIALEDFIALPQTWKEKDDRTKRT